MPLPSWQLLPSVDIAEFDRIEQSLHHASQLIAMVAYSYLPAKEDHSQATISWSAENTLLQGLTIPSNTSFEVAIHVPSFELRLLAPNSNRILLKTTIAGKTLEMLTDWLRLALAGMGLNPEQLNPIEAYQLAEHPILQGAPFETLNGELVNAWIKSRTNAMLALTEINKTFKTTSAIAIWPHHFDMGIYHIVKKESKTGAEQQSIGIGWAVSDTVANAPYLYVYGWSANGNIDYSNVPDLPFGKWQIDPEGWTGAYFSYTELASIEEEGTLQSAMSQFLKEAKIAYLTMF